ncbi:MAG: alpha-amylase family glycosyl hydrolase [Planctomycetota bacterium]
MEKQTEFFISREARDRYRVRDTLFTPSGKAVHSLFHGARVFARKMNEVAEEAGRPPFAKAGDLNALGLIHAIFHRVIDLYREQVNPQAFSRALKRFQEGTGEGGIEGTLRSFMEVLPPAEVYREEADAEAFLHGETRNVPHRRILFDEALLIWLANRNPAAAPYLELFDETPLRQGTAYGALLETVRKHFDTEPPFGPDEENLVEMLLRPAREVPDSLIGQLEYIRARWAHLLGDYLALLLRAIDLAKEESKWGLPVAGESVVIEYTGLEGEPERFTPDRDWMPNLVMIAKNVTVWLHQLSKWTGTPIHRLDQIPDAELDRLAAWGLTGLWLIGAWERSPASRRVKTMCGNPEAMASAYAVFAYEIASDLGGEEAFQNLKARALARGIRMATDMVPNHMGMDSPWVIEHPDWFLSLEESPYPAYRFDTANLSWAEGVGLHLEAHYFDRTDAAVVFLRRDEGSGEQRFLYHGNDGTSMPWNDTAQLDYLNPEVREAVIQAILRVAQKSPIIRFDAAMTLTRRHYHRLWFPAPGAGGAIPTRAEHGLTKSAFDGRMPQEFWREVVDRVQAEAPDTLLLAEAFWLMEGYFVRTLGMHRVYNSAFMNMLKDEENANYRTVLKNTLEFDPEVLQRFVNFLSNPDEETALAQFGKGDKYFGVCTMAATLPGLPLFAHGQIEGFAEKYGMEYGRAYWEEDPDEGFVRYHEKTIFPLLHRRSLFAGSQHFRLYDFFDDSGTVNEDVFAYSNRAGEERALVVVHNRYAEAKGWIRTSVAFLRKGERGGGLAQETLAEGLGLAPRPDAFWIFRDHVTDLEYLRGAVDMAEVGIYVELGAYQRHVFLDFHEVRDHPDRPYRRLAGELAGGGVPDMAWALWEIRLRPVREAFGRIASPALIERTLEDWERGSAPVDAASKAAAEALKGFIAEADRVVGRGEDPSRIASNAGRKLAVLLDLPGAVKGLEGAEDAGAVARVESLEEPGAGSFPLREALLAWVFLHPLGSVQGMEGGGERSLRWMEEWGLEDGLAGAFTECGWDDEKIRRVMRVSRILIRHQEDVRLKAFGGEGAEGIAVRLRQDGEVRAFLQAEEERGEPGYGRDPLDPLVRGLFFASLADLLAAPEGEGTERTAEIVRLHEFFSRLQASWEGP